MTAPPSARFAFGHPAHFIALGFGTGLAPLGPGTAGAMLAFRSTCCSTAGSTARDLPRDRGAVRGRRLGLRAHRARLGAPDHRAMNWDEVVAMMLILLVVPDELEWWLFSFGAFRFFDVAKPRRSATSTRR